MFEDFQDDPLLSSPSKRIYQKRNLILCMLLLFLSNAGFSIISPSLWPYLHHVGSNKLFYGICVSMYSLGGVIGNIVFGFWVTKRSYKEVLFISLVIIIVSSVGYSVSFNQYAILCFRLLQGFGGGNVGILQSFVASRTSLINRTAYMARLNLVGNLGYALGPAFGAALTFLHVKFWKIELTPFSSTGYFCALMAIIGLVLMLLFFVESEDLSDVELDENESNIKKKNKPSMLSTISINASLLFIYWSVYNCLAAYETIATPLTMDEYDWGVLENSLLWAGVSTLSCFAFIFLDFMSKRVSDSFLLISHLILLLGGLVGIISWSGDTKEWRFLCGTSLVTLGFAISQAETISIYSKIQKAKNQAKMMGFISASGALARMVGPIWSSYAYQHYSYDPVFGILSILTFLSLTLYCTLFFSKCLSS